VADEIYEHLVYGDAEHVSMPVAVPALADTCVVVNGVAKTYAMTGWRVGWLIGPADVVKAPPTCSRTPPATSATSRRCRAGGRSRRPVGGRRDAGGLRPAPADDGRPARRHPGVSCPEPEGAFYCYPSVKGVLGKTLRGRTPTTSAELAELVLDEVGVAVVPGEAFGTPGYFRLSYALGDEDLEKGVSRLADLLAEAQ
jgi:aspartate/methionine/tyrosine aminotransferase